MYWDGFNLLVRLEHPYDRIDQVVPKNKYFIIQFFKVYIPLS